MRPLSLPPRGQGVGPTSMPPMSQGTPGIPSTPGAASTPVTPPPVTPNTPPAWGRNFMQQYGMPPGHAFRDYREANPTAEMSGGLPGMMSDPAFLSYLTSLPPPAPAGAVPDLNGLRAALANLGLGQGDGQGAGRGFGLRRRASFL